MEPVSTTTALALGAGWFANKVLGPSADELGSQLKAFVGERTRKIVSGAGKKADPDKAKPLSAAFFFNFSQKAAFSDESDEINEMWSSLLADASEGQSYRHSLFADILTRLGCHEARYLASFCKELTDPKGYVVEASDIRIAFELALKEIGVGVTDEKFFNKLVVNKVDEIKFGWPIRFEYIRFYAQTLSGDHLSAGLTTIFDSEEAEFAVEVLKREGLIHPFKIDLVYPWGNGKLEGLHLTKIGAEFFVACNRSDN